MRHTIKDWGQRLLMPYLNGEIYEFGCAVDTDAGVIYGFLYEGGRRVWDLVTREPVLAIYRGAVELRVQDGLDELLKRHTQALLDEWAKTGGTPLAEFEEYTKAWQPLLTNAP